MKNIYVLLDNIRSLYNVGSIFRTSDAAGVKKIFLCGITATPEYAKLTKTSLGAEKTVDWEYAKNSIDKVNELKSKGNVIICAEITRTSIDFNNANYPDNSVIVFGHEVDGINKDIIELADYCVKIPMRGLKESLNVATSFGIIIYEALKDN